MRRVLVAAIASLLIAGLIVPAVAAAPASKAVPRVVVIVGPSGAATDRYRAQARDAAALARKFTPDVTELYSPNATWPAVKDALQGASVVIYMGHGNGWPSKYRDSLYPPSQNGFGLNPTTTSGDSRHQYFGEARIAESIKLAKNAVVLLNHLCYASGNSEPGVPEGSMGQARQRVDNFAAGFIKAGASAVIAEAQATPNHMLATILRGGKSIEASWRTGPWANGNAFAFDSARSPGYVAMMDPERANSGFTRSIVLKAGLASGDVLANARGQANSAAVGDPVAGGPSMPSLVAAGMTLSAPTTNGLTVASGKFYYKIPFDIGDRALLPKSVQASVRWDPIDVVALDPAAETAPVSAPAEPAATPDAETAPAATPDAETAPAATPDAETAPASAKPEPVATPDADTAPVTAPPVEPTPEITPAAQEPAKSVPDFGLVTPEQLGQIVAPYRVKIQSTRLAFYVAAPTTPGRYRLTVMLHDAEGVAYDAATQAMIPSLLVRVTGDLHAGIDAPTHLDLAPGAAGDIPLWVANLGRSTWGHPANKAVKDPEGFATAEAAVLTGTWVALDAAGNLERQAAADAASVIAVELPAGFESGAATAANLKVFAPSAPGDYLLILEVITPEAGSLTAKGVEPTIIRVTVG